MNRSRTIALLGGTFNPVHNGHLGIAEAAIAELGYQLILFVPSMVPVHKTPDTATSADHRLAMLHLATEELEQIAVDECEIRRGGLSYTIDTMEHIFKSYEFAGKPGLIIGDDLVDGFRTWRRVEELVAKVDLVVAGRMSARPKVLPYVHRYLDNPLFPFASREIRTFVEEGRNIDELVPVCVADYIAAHGLYRAGVD